MPRRCHALVASVSPPPSRRRVLWSSHGCAMAEVEAYFVPEDAEVLGVGVGVQRLVRAAVVHRHVGDAREEAGVLEEVACSASRIQRNTTLFRNVNGIHRLDGYSSSPICYTIHAPSASLSELVIGTLILTPTPQTMCIASSFQGRGPASARLTRSGARRSSCARRTSRRSCSVVWTRSRTEAPCHSVPMLSGRRFDHCAD